ncbi:MAG: efflux RND transporter periplasmic adaptor subunit [candidate division NC10 bacterium]|nr:efflux RND transporter periplasmic adaptor subunit [candidate division NC10 bacterium]
MSPAKRPEEKRRRLILALGPLALLALAGASYLYWEAPVVTVRVAPLKRGEMVVTVSATATGAIESEAEVKVSSQAISRLERLLVDEGDYVRVGERIALLDQKEGLAQLELARANLSAARARLAQAEAGVDMQKTQVETQIAKTKANLENAERNWKRSKDLYARGAISLQQLDAAEVELEVARAAYEAAMADKAQDAVKAEEVAAARAAVKQAGASVALAETQLGYTTVHAPISGRVSKKWASEGELMTVGTPIVTLVDEARLYVRATIDEYDARRIRVGQPVNVSLDAFPGRAFRGRLYHISPVVSGARQETRTFTIKVALEGERPVIKPGMSADIEVIAADLKGVLYLPSQAVIEREGQKWVYVMEGGRARLVPVKVGESNWNYTEIKGGPAEGTLVVLNPDAPNLKDGARVKIKEGP